MKNKTLTSKVILLLIISMVFLLILLLGTSLMFYQRSKRDFEEKKQDAIHIYVQSIKEHLNKGELQLIDLMLTTFYEADLDSTNDMTRYLALNRINTTLKNKISANSDVDCLFVKKENTFMLKGYNTLLPTRSRYHIMEFFKKNEQIDTFNTRDGYWQIMTIDGEAFFYLVYEMGGYTVGALIRVSIFDATLSVIMDRDIGSYSYIKNDKDIYTFTIGTAERRAKMIDKGYNNRFVSERVVIKSIIPNTDVTFVGNFKVRVITLFLNNTFIIMIGIVSIFIGMLFIIKSSISHYIINPINRLLDGMHHVAQGKFNIHITEDAGTLEFNELSKSFNQMVKEIVDLRISSYEQRIKDSERRIKLLRMQIKPHFFLNSITTIRSMTYQDKTDEIRLYLDSLSDHIRYMLRVNSSEVMLTEELTHIENYLHMQEIKFTNSVAYYIGCSDELKYKKIGHLILFTIIENSFKFAMSLYETLIILIQCEVVEEDGFIGYRVIIEDNGVGFPTEQLEKFRIGNEVEEKQDGKHIGLSNIKKTLELQYGRNDLLRLSNVEPHGARVEIRIPDSTNYYSEEIKYENSHC
jgi:sensor histidine kinase YesM